MPRPPARPPATSTRPKRVLRRARRVALLALVSGTAALWRYRSTSLARHEALLLPTVPRATE